MDFIIAATEKNIMMVEGEAKECSEDDLVKALEVAHEAIRLQIRAQQELRDMVGVAPKRDYPKPAVNEVVKKRVEEYSRQRMEQDSRGNLPKAERKERYKKLYEELKALLAKEANLPEGEEIDDETKKMVKNYLADLQYDRG